MRSKLAARLVLCAVLTGSVAATVLLPGGPAFALATRPTEVICTTLSGDITGGAIYSGCTDTQTTGGGGTTVAGSISTTWDTGLTSIFTVTSAKALLGKKDKCAASAGDTNAYELRESGIVSDGTATALINGKWKHTICAFTTPSGDTLFQYFPGTVGRY